MEIVRDSERMSLGTYITPQAHDKKVNHGVGLFSEAIQFSFLPYAKITCHRAAEVYGENLANHGPEDDVVKDEEDVKITLLVAWVLWGRVRDVMREEEKDAKRVPC